MTYDPPTEFESTVHPPAQRLYNVIAGGYARKFTDFFDAWEYGWSLVKSGEHPNVYKLYDGRVWKLIPDVYDSYFNDPPELD